MYYTGVGSRKTPRKIQSIMTNIATHLERFDYILRSGGAVGADTAFAMGAGSKKQIFVPWSGYNGHKKEFEIDKRAMMIAAQHHPAWHNLHSSVRALMARNVHQVLGPNLTLDKKSKFLICWTPDGCETTEARTIETGGTGLAISVACSFNVPVYNIKNKISLENVENFIDNLYASKIELESPRGISKV